jgi:3-methyladenine DNA glycosylase AlkD
MMHNYLEPLLKEIESAKNAENAYWMKKYMKDQFEFYGVKTPERRTMVKSFLKKYSLPPANELKPVIMDCWSNDYRDWQYVAISLLMEYIKKPEKDIVGLLEFMVVNKSWWDTVDGIAGWLVGPLFIKYPDLIEPKTTQWMNSGNIWLQRTCLLYQLNYKKNTDTEILFRFIEQLSGETSFWIRKAIGWVLREYSKTNPESVLKFVNSHQLSSLSRKEALKVISRKT